MFGNLFTNIYSLVAPEPVHREMRIPNSDLKHVIAHNEVGERVILEMQKDYLSERMPIKVSIDDGRSTPKKT
jgi:hypothetical protein